MTHATLVYADSADWEGLYIDGRIVDENHSLSIRHVWDVLAKEAEGSEPFEQGFQFSKLEVTDAWMYDEGRLPEYLGQIPEEARVRCPRG